MRARRIKLWVGGFFIVCVCAGVNVGCSDSDSDNGGTPGNGSTTSALGDPPSNDTPKPKDNGETANVNPQEEWPITAENFGYSFEVKSFYGTYDAAQKDENHPSKSLTEKTETWPGDWPDPPEASGETKIGVSFPHMFNDPYWAPVNYGIYAEAELRGIHYKLLEAGGYQYLGKQRDQLLELKATNGINGIILGGIHYSELDPTIETITKDTPVIEVINDIQAEAITAKAMVSFHDMGKNAGVYVQNDSGGKDVNVAFFPGPEGAGWVQASLDGFQEAVGENVKIVTVAHGNTEAIVQRSRIKEVLGEATETPIDYLVGNAVAASEATGVVTDEEIKKLHPNIKIVSVYIIPPVYVKIQEGTIAAAPCDFMLDQGRMAVDMMLRHLNGQKPGVDIPFRSGPVIQVISKDNIDQFSYERLFGPRRQFDDNWVARKDVPFGN